MTPERVDVSNKEYRTITNCRSCGSSGLEDILSLGNQRIVGFTKEDTQVPVVPLTLTLCSECHLLQLKHTTRPDLLWGDQYWYRSGVNQTMRLELAEIARDASRVGELRSGDIVVDIGANDGTLLASYDNPDLIRVGFDPSRNLVPYFRDTLSFLPIGKSCLFVDYFNADAFKRKYGESKAKVITAIAMFYDLDDPNSFVHDVTRILDENGVFVIQQNYLVGMLRQNAFDNICHEHLEYYSLLSLEPLLARHGLEVFSVSENDINGGSLRTFVGFRGKHRVESNVSWTRDRELDLQLSDRRTYHEFTARITDNGYKLRELLTKLVEEGKRVFIYGASTRGNTLLQFYGIDGRLIAGAAERNPDKFGLQIPGTGIGIVPEEEARSSADYFLVLPWYFRKEFLEREKEWHDKRGRFIFPLPRMEVV